MGPDASYHNIKIYRVFHLRQPLLTLVMTDERLYRDDHVIYEALVAQQTGGDPVDGNNSIGSRYCAPRTTLLALEAMRTQQLGRTPSILGPTPEDRLVEEHAEELERHLEGLGQRGLAQAACGWT